MVLQAPCAGEASQAVPLGVCFFFVSERRCKDSDVLVTVGRQDIGVWKRRREGRQLAARGSRLKRGTEGEGRRAQEYNYLLTYLSRQ